MARSHHRKKHKEHLRQFQHSHESALATTPKRKAAKVFTVVGAVIGLAVSYFATNRSVLWVIAGVIAGSAAGYLLGRNIDKQPVK
jgi:hypothetical protein